MEMTQSRLTKLDPDATKYVSATKSQIATKNSPGMKSPAKQKEMAAPGVQKSFRNGAVKVQSKAQAIEVPAVAGADLNPYFS